MQTPSPPTLLPRAWGARLLPLLLLIAVALLLAAASAGYARTAAGPARPADWPDFPIVTATADQVNPAVGDGVIVWADKRDFPLNDNDIYAYSVLTGGEFPLVTEGLSQDEPATSGDWVVYRQGTNISFQYDLRAIRLSTRQVITIAGGAANPINPAISGNYVVWQDSRNYPSPSGYDIYGYNLATNQEFTVTTAPQNQFVPHISGNIVVWQDLRNMATTSWDIYGYDISTHATFTICTAPGSQWLPDVSGNWVVWQDYRNDPSDPDVYGFNLTTRQEIPIAVHTGTQETPRISGNWVVWDDNRNDPFSYDIYGYNLATGVEYPIKTLPSFQNAPAISGTLVAWQDYRNTPSEADIYAANLPLDPPTATPGTPSATPTRTATATPPAATPTATPTVCAIQFADVPPTHPFYAYIQWVACHAIVSGYQCGGAGEPCNPQNDPYYRPGANATRGQISKMVVNGMAWPIQTPTTPTFEDVPASQPFYVFVETAYAHALISGYTCGGPGEPCVPPGNRPYFRPGNDVTRGQLAKIIVNAKAWGPLVSPTPTFEDVDATNPFFGFVERAYQKGIISGYTCGGPGEPCVPPGNRPYFRPYNNATRAQLAKILNLALTQP